MVAPFQLCLGRASAFALSAFVVVETHLASIKVADNRVLPVRQFHHQPGDLAREQASLALLPNRWAQIHPEHRLTEREEEPREARARRRRKRAARRAAASA
jgi:hypothetical protein